VSGANASISRYFSSAAERSWSAGVGNGPMLGAGVPEDPGVADEPGLGGVGPALHATTTTMDATEASVAMRAHQAREPFTRATTPPPSHRFPAAVSLIRSP
jgi:hypothetical protein